MTKRNWKSIQTPAVCLLVSAVVFRMTLLHYAEPLPLDKAWRPIPFFCIIGTDTAGAAVAFSLAEVNPLSRGLPVLERVPDDIDFYLPVDSIQQLQQEVKETYLPFAIELSNDRPEERSQTVTVTYFGEDVYQWRYDVAGKSISNLRYGFLGRRSAIWAAYRALAAAFLAWMVLIAGKKLLLPRMLTLVKKRKY